MALINSGTGTALKVTELDENGKNQLVDGKWLIPNENAPDIIETAFQVLGLSLDDTQLWKNDGSGFRNVIVPLTTELQDDQLWTCEGSTEDCMDGKGALSKDYSFLGTSAF